MQKSMSLNYEPSSEPLHISPLFQPRNSSPRFQLRNSSPPFQMEKRPNPAIQWCDGTSTIMVFRPVPQTVWSGESRARKGVIPEFLGAEIVSPVSGGHVAAPAGSENATFHVSTQILLPNAEVRPPGLCRLEELLGRWACFRRDGSIYCHRGDFHFWLWQRLGQA